MTQPEATADPLSCAALLLIAFIAAGTAQTVWLRSPVSRRFGWPLDLGLTLRGRRLFGENKTVRGFVVLVPAAAASFFLLGSFAQDAPGFLAGAWDLSPRTYGLLGFWAGLGFMLGELPNSFVKRQLDIAPGAAPRRPAARVLSFAVDRLDSLAGMAVAVSLAVPTPWQTWVYLAVFGPAVHWSFSVVLYWWGVKGRPA
jgi:hypothetical protein